MRADAKHLPLSLDPLIAEAKQRARRRWLVISLGLLLLVGGTATALTLRSPGPSPLVSPKGGLGSAVTAALAQQSVHWTESGGEDMRGAFRLTSDVTASSGEQRLTILPRGASADIRLVNGALYVEGSPLGLQWTLGLTEAQAARYAGRWILIARSDDVYARTTNGLTLGSLVHDTTSPDLGNSGKPKVITGTCTGPGSVSSKMEKDGGSYVSLSMQASGARLPDAVAVNFGPGTWFDGCFSNWNKPVSVLAPTHSVPIATVRGR